MRFLKKHLGFSASLFSVWKWGFWGQMTRIFLLPSIEWEKWLLEPDSTLYLIFGYVCFENLALECRLSCLNCFTILLKVNCRGSISAHVASRKISQNFPWQKNIPELKSLTIEILTGVAFLNASLWAGHDVSNRHGKTRKIKNYLHTLFHLFGTVTSS